VSAACGLDRHGRQTLRAVLGCGRRRLFGTLHAVHRPYHHEDGERHDHEVEDRVDENPVVDGRRAGLGGLGEGGIRRRAEIEEEAAEREERYLQTAFSQYAAYALNTKRFLPYLY
jgi:hypothetical protein